MIPTLRAACCLIGILAASLAVAQDADFRKAGFKITKVTDSVYLLEGPVSNIGVYVGAEGVVAVDDGLQPMAQMVRSALTSISAKPVRYVINTHEHPDHTGGNAEFTKDALIIAHDNVRNRMETGGASGSGGALRFDTLPGAGESLPVLTFDKTLTLHLIAEQIRVVHFPNAHTIGDSMVFFQKSRVVATGDIFSNGVFPFIDRLGGGSIDGVIAARRTLLEQSPRDIKVIPGHGPVSSLVASTSPC
jgi:glyoxylase-like metal-dependent hydrolase (beta-lactamase superfamily II)